MSSSISFDGNQQERSFLTGAKALLFTGPLNLLLICIPVVFVGISAGWSDSSVFLLSLLSIAPLAERLVRRKTLYKHSKYTVHTAVLHNNFYTLNVQRVL